MSDSLSQILVIMKLRLNVRDIAVISGTMQISLVACSTVAVTKLVDCSHVVTFKRTICAGIGFVISGPWPWPWL